MRQGVKNIGRNKMFSIASIATMAACIFVFGVFFAMVLNVNFMVKKAEEGVAFTVFFKQDTTKATKDEIGTELKQLDGVLSVKYVSPEEALKNFENYFDGDKQLMEGFKDDNPLAYSDNYEVYLKDVSKQAKLVSSAEALNGVREVRHSDVVAKTLTKVNKLLGIASAIVIAILLAVSIFLISNTVTMGINIRREEIAIMKYIGAKDSFVRAPFVLEGVLIGVIGAIIPLAILYVMYNRAIHYVMSKFALLNNIMEFLPVHKVYATLLPLGLILGIGIGFVGSFLTIRKHLRV
jgi:cell division transport system permease protein